MLVTGCEDKNAYTWDVHAILKEAGIEELLRSIGDSGIWHIPRSSFDDKSFLGADATRCLGQFGVLDKFSPAHGMEVNNLLLSSYLDLCALSPPKWLTPTW